MIIDDNSQHSHRHVWSKFQNSWLPTFSIKDNQIVLVYQQNKIKSIKKNNNNHDQYLSIPVLAMMMSQLIFYQSLTFLLYVCVQMQLSQTNICGYDVKNDLSLQVCFPNTGRITTSLLILIHLSPRLMLFIIHLISSRWQTWQLPTLIGRRNMSLIFVLTPKSAKKRSRITIPDSWSILNLLPKRIAIDVTIAVSSPSYTYSVTLYFMSPVQVTVNIWYKSSY